MVHHDKPNTLSSLRKLVQAIDTQYWEQCGEVSRETCTSGNKSQPKSDQSKLDNKSSKGSLSKQKNNSGSTQAKISEPKEPTSDLLLKLSKDSELMPQERHC